MNTLQAYLSDLKEQRFSDNEIANLIIEKHGCACSQSTISRIRSGKIERPNWSIGDALTKLHAELVTGKPGLSDSKQIPPYNT